MKKILILLFALTLSLSLMLFCACDPKPDTGEGDEGGGNTEEKGEPILVIFQYGTSVTRNYYYKGTTPNPPVLEDINMGSYIIHFTGKWTPEIVPVDGEATYIA